MKNKQPTIRSYLMEDLDDDFREMSLNSSVCQYRGSLPPASVAMEVQGDGMQKRRGTMYQSSREVRKKKEKRGQRRKIDSSHRSEAFLPFEIFNSSSEEKYEDPTIQSEYQHKQSSLLATGNGISNIRSREFRKSLLNNFSGETHRTGCSTPLNERDQAVNLSSSPVHLNGILKLEFRCGVPSFEFSSKDQEDILSAKTLRLGSEFNWVYTFHSSKKKISSSSSWNSKHRQTQSSLLIGQMHAFCYLCSEISSSGFFDNSTVMEFVSYEIQGEVYDSMDLDTVDASNSHASAQTPLPPQSEIAAVVIRIPFNKDDKLEDWKRDEVCPEECNTVLDSLYPVNVKVITPSGRHGLARTGRGPSPLLDRWRSGGGCDCGGWDMGCPIVVLNSNGGEDLVDNSSVKSHSSFKLSVQGTKDNIPALTITPLAEGQYSVYFHAQFSTLQAFSISVAIMHCLQSAVSDQERIMSMLHSNSLKLLLREEVRQLVDAIAEKEKIKEKKIVPEPKHQQLSL